jgi:hypothetical protein
MSILRDRIRPLDPSSLQKFLGQEAQGEGEGDTQEPLATSLSTPLQARDTATGVSPDPSNDVVGLGTTR